MRITIEVLTLEPPCGRVSIDRPEEAAFEGWLQLLSILTAAFQATPSAGPPPGPAAPGS